MLPFTLQYAKDGNWRAHWAEAKMFIVVGGSEEAPDPGLVATLTDVVEHWANVRERVAAHVAGLATDEHVALEPASIGGFAAKSCGFDQELFFDSIWVPDPAQPDRVEITFYTGYPDGYATYRIALVAGEPTTITAYAA